MRPLSLSPTKTYEPVLDGLRAISILFVVLRHLEFTTLISANLGVTIFFFISGLIITRLLLVEFNQNAKINITAFLCRRLLRLVPALLICVISTVIIATILKLAIDWKQVSAGLLYYMNYYSVFARDTGIGYVLPINHLWSLAVEEHYYLIYPVIFALLARNLKHFLAALMMTISIIFLWRLFNILVLDFTPKYNYFATESRIETILFGCALTVLAYHSTVESSLSSKILNFCGSNTFVLVGSIFLLSTLFIPGELLRHSVRYTVQGILLFLVFAGLLFSNKTDFFRNLLSLTPLVFLGKISYSLYLYHLPVWFFITQFFDAPPRHKGNSLSYKFIHCDGLISLCGKANSKEI